MREDMNLTDVLKNVLIACEANGLRDLPFVRDARHAVERIRDRQAHDALRPCRHCGAKPLVSENNVPGNWYGHIECGNAKCDVRPCVGYGGTLADASEEIAEWNNLAGTADHPEIVFDWKKVSEREWRATVATGWEAEVIHSLGDGTWSFRVNNSGRSQLASKDEAVRQAEEWMRVRVIAAVADARRVLDAFALPHASGTGNGEAEIVGYLIEHDHAREGRDFQWDPLSERDRARGYRQTALVRRTENHVGNSAHEEFLEAFEDFRAENKRREAELREVDRPRDVKAVSLAREISERGDFNLRIRDFWSNAAKDLAAYVLYSRQSAVAIPGVDVPSHRELIDRVFRQNEVRPGSSFAHGATVGVMEAVLKLRETYPFSPADRADAELFRALMRCGRIKMQGSSGVNAETGERNGKNVHFGAEFWPEPIPEGYEEHYGASTKWGRACLRALAEAILEEEVKRAKVEREQEEERRNEG